MPSLQTSGRRRRSLRHGTPACPLLAVFCAFLPYSPALTPTRWALGVARFIKTPGCPDIRVGKFAETGENPRSKRRKTSDFSPALPCPAAESATFGGNRALQIGFFREGVTLSRRARPKPRAGHKTKPLGVSPERSHSPIGPPQVSAVPCPVTVAPHASLRVRPSSGASPEPYTARLSVRPYRGSRHSRPRLPALPLIVPAAQSGVRVDRCPS